MITFQMSMLLMPFLTTFQLLVHYIYQLLDPKLMLLFPFVIIIKSEKMKTDLISSDLISNPPNDADTLYKQYHTTLTTLIDKHAPLHTKHTKAKYIPGWVNDAVIAAKETKRLFEGIWRRNKSHFNRSQYMQKVHQYNRTCIQGKSEFLKAKIQDNHHDPKKLWQILGDVLHRLPARMLPSINPPRLLADRFVEFSSEKIEKNMLNFSYLPEVTTHHPRLSPQCFPPSLLLLRIK